MLWFIGTGIGGYRGLSIQAVDVLKECDVIYVERFTSALGEPDLQGLRSIVGKDVTPVQRWFVEDGREIIAAAKSGRVALVTYGDPLLATTHNELRARAAKSTVSTSVLHSASGIYSAIGETGLHVYKFGRIVTIMSEPQSAVSVYNAVFRNLLSGNHTLILTEYRLEDGVTQPFFMDPTAAFEMLLDAESDLKYRVFSPETFVIVASRVGDDTQKIISGRVTNLSKKQFGEGPHSIIVPASLHFTESDALKSLTQVLDEPSDNCRGMESLSVQMVRRYSPRALRAVQQMREFVRAEKDRHEGNGVFDVLDNAESYIADAERFLNEGKSELAVLSIGYAEGLVDALRFQKGVNPWLPPG